MTNPEIIAVSIGSVYAKLGRDFYKPTINDVSGMMYVYIRYMNQNTIPALGYFFSAGGGCWFDPSQCQNFSLFKIYLSKKYIFIKFYR